MNRTLDIVRKLWHHGNGKAVFVEVSPPAAVGVASSEKILAAAGVPAHLVYPHTTLSRLLDQTADRFGDARAMTYQDRHWTYAELLQWTNRIAGGLSALGIRRGDRVILTLPNCPEFVACFFAIQKLAAVVVNAGPLMGVDDLHKTLLLTTPTAAIGLDLRAGPMLQAAIGTHDVQHWIWTSLSGYQAPLDRLGYRMKLWTGRNGNGHHHDKKSHISLADLVAAAPARPPSLQPDLDQTAVLQPTGGTTGGLKLAQLTHRSLIANATQVDVSMRCSLGQERILALLPMFHVYGLTTCLLNGVMSGADLILLTRFNVGQTLEAWRKHAPTIFPIVPAICDKLSDALELSGEKLASVPRVCLSGAAPLPADTAERFERLTGAELIEGYGLTEASPVTHANLTGHRRLGSIGIPLPDTKCRVVDLDGSGRDVAVGEPGEMLISGPQLMSGYYGDPVQTKVALSTDAEGLVWLHTGDIVRTDADGYFFVVDRKKDMIIRSGMKVYPGRVEEVLKSCLGVADVAVFGRADPVHTEMVVAAVVTEGNVDFAELSGRLMELSRKRLAPYEVPGLIERVEIIPRSPLGKVLKVELRRQKEQV